MRYEPTQIPKLKSYKSRKQEYSKRREQALASAKWPAIAFTVVPNVAIWCMWAVNIPSQNPVSMQAAIVTTIFIILATGLVLQGLVSAVVGKKPHPDDIKIDQAMRRLLGMPDEVEVDQN